MYNKDDDCMRLLDVSLTRSCNYNCSWCNQRQDLTSPVYDMSDSPRVIASNKIRSGKEWIDGLNEFPDKNQYEKVIFSGGEPSIHPDFFNIVSQVKGYESKIIVTNLSFNVFSLMEALRKSNASVIVQPSFHFEFADFKKFIEKMRFLRREGMLSNFIPVSIVDLPDRREPKEFVEKFRNNGFLASLYKFEGYYNGKFNYADENIFGSKGSAQEVDCCSSSTCVKPSGDINFCQTDTYDDDSKSYGNICDKNYVKIPINRDCDRCGVCHISCASWVKMRDKGSGANIWRGKNYRKKNILNCVRSYCEKRNFKNLDKLKVLHKNIKGIFYSS